MTFSSIPASRAIMRSMPPGSTVKIAGTVYAPESSDMQGIMLRRMDSTEIVEFFRWEDIAILRASGNWRYDPPPRIATGSASYTCDLTLLSAKARAKIVLMARVLSAIHELHTKGEVTFTDRGLAEALRKIAPQLAKAEVNQQFPGRALRMGDQVVLAQLPSTRSIRRVYRKFIRANFDLRVLVRKPPRQGHAGSYFEPEVEELMQQGIREFGKLGGSAPRTVAENTQNMIRRVSNARLEKGLSALKIPCIKTIERRIAALDPFEMTALREGIDAARRKFASSGLGVQQMAQFPGERIEIDEWEVDLWTYFTRIGLTNALPPEILEKLPKGRRWIYAIIDCATRCILALSVVRNPSAEAAMRALRMASVDKTEYARAIGARSAWSFCAGFSVVCADTGAAFNNSDFPIAVNDLGATMLFPPVKIPELRGHIERWFGNLSQNLMPYLSGRTYHNPVARGDYPTEQLTALDDEDLTRVLSLYVIDYYHNRPHRGLNGQTPAQRWRELEDQFAVTEPADLHTLRAALGVEFTRKPSKKGIELFSHHYSCDALRRLWETGKRSRLRVKADPADIGAISIEIDGKWETAEAVTATPLFGISLAEWAEKFREIKQRYAHEAELTESIRTRSIEEIRAVNKAARIRAGVMPGEPSYEQIKAIQKNLFHGTSFRTGPAVIETPAEGFIGQRITLPPEDSPEASSPTDPSAGDNHQPPSDTADDSAWGFDDE